MKKCIRCNATISWDREFCPICGGELAAARGENPHAAPVTPPPIATEPAKALPLEVSAPPRPIPAPPVLEPVMVTPAPAPRVEPDIPTPPPARPSIPTFQVPVFTVPADLASVSKPPLSEPAATSQPPLPPQVTLPSAAPLPPQEVISPPAAPLPQTAPPMPTLPPMPTQVVQPQTPPAMTPPPVPAPQVAPPATVVVPQSHSGEAGQMPPLPPIPSMRSAENEDAVSFPRQESMSFNPSPLIEEDGSFSRLGRTTNDLSSSLGGSGVFVKPDFASDGESADGGVFSKLGEMLGGNQPVPPQEQVPQPPQPTPQVKKSAAVTSGEFLKMFPDADPGESVLDR